eukprot:TRINITY_DN4285_c0_g1_i1.p1 TRINITY_DN4285_c0_g1~~TRINITY_DN4285_c0_g1_i1.p1  ORF type:complete len:317 (+),score=58.50 TRINITY_DN4285_c0_g1_i1:66-1016(+)
MSQADDTSETFLETILNLEEIDTNLYRGSTPLKFSDRIFGGQTLGQSLAAAGKTIEAPFVVHSLHAYFLRPGDVRVPILYQVERTRDGKGFTNRNVVAYQRGTPIFSVGVSFHIPEDSMSHQYPMPKVPSPEEVPTMKQRIIKHSEDIRLPEHLRKRLAKAATLPFPFEMRRITDWDTFHPTRTDPMQRVWLKVNGKLSDNPLIHQCAAAYLSDYSFIETSLYPHGLSFSSKNIQSASLDHSMWFHEPNFRADDWLFYDMECPRLVSGRGLCHGRFYDTKGKLLISTAQEGLIRIADESKKVAGKAKKTEEPKPKL